jgi:hypothetical protein
LLLQGKRILKEASYCIQFCDRVVLEYFSARPRGSARHWRAFLLSACGLSVPVDALGRIEAPVSAAKNPVPGAAAARMVLFAENQLGAKPSRANCSDHSAGASRKAATPMPRGSRPSTAALTRSGAMKAMEIAYLRGHAKPPPGLIIRVPATEIETAVAKAIAEHGRHIFAERESTAGLPADVARIEVRKSALALRRLRTTPARKPRTECDCQPVAFVSAAMVAPLGERSISMAADCFVPGRTAATRLPFGPALLGFGRLLDGVVDLAAVRFFAVFVIGISFGSGATSRLHRRSPAKALKPAGRDPGAASAPEASTVALRSQRNASPFWIILLLRLPATERGMIRWGWGALDFELFESLYRSAFCRMVVSSNHTVLAPRIRTGLYERARNLKRTQMLSEQRSTRLRRFFNLGGDLVPDLFTFNVAIVSQLFCALFDLLVSVKSVMCTAEIRVHHNSVLTRNPHDDLLDPTGRNLARGKLDKQVGAVIMTTKGISLSIHMFI